MKLRFQDNIAVQTPNENSLENGESEDSEVYRFKGSVRHDTPINFVSHLANDEEEAERNRELADKIVQKSSQRKSSISKSVVSY